MSFMTKLATRPTAPAPAEAPAATAGARTVEVRPYEGADRDGVLGMRLSGRSLYLRFFAGTPRIPDFYADMLGDIDHRDREALVATAGAEIIGIAEYVRDETLPEAANLAVLVADSWQRRGVGRRLVTALSRLAHDRGIAELRADVLVENHAARAALRDLWPQALATHGEEGGLVYRVALGAAEPAPGTVSSPDPAGKSTKFPGLRNRRSPSNWAG
jgi:GNAT superfamily N-acetyltransferase